MTSEPTSGRSRTRVCHIAATTEGAVWVFEQLRDLRDRYGYDVSAILSGEQGELVEKFRAAGIPVHAVSFDFMSSTDFLPLPRKVLTLRRLRCEQCQLAQLRS